jgi:predicted kinase
VLNEVARGEQKVVEDLWREACAAHQARIRQQNRVAWYAHHEHMRELHEGLAREHEAKASALLEEGP